MAREPRPWPLGWDFGGKLSLVYIIISWIWNIRKLVIASVQDVNTLPAAIIYFLEAAHFTHLNLNMAGWYISRDKGGNRKY